MATPLSIATNVVKSYRERFGNVPHTRQECLVKVMENTAKIARVCKVDPQKAVEAAIGIILGDQQRVAA